MQAIFSSQNTSTKQFNDLISCYT
ncbi:protein of unknown function [Cyanobium sp. NIES-981]|nr:protein of unknown function [Cyanobium sp. NIES-981]